MIRCFTDNDVLQTTGRMACTTCHPELFEGMALAQSVTRPDRLILYELPLEALCHPCSY